jgi:hypothetical protein
MMISLVLLVISLEAIFRWLEQCGERKLSSTPATAT